MYGFNKSVLKIVEQPKESYIKIRQEESGNIGFKKINETGFNIIKLLYEGFDKNQIIERLSHQYSDSNLSNKVNSFIETLEKFKLIKKIEDQIYRPLYFGSNDFFTPSYIILEISENCLLNCSHCYLGKKKTNYMDFDKLKLLLANLYELGVDTIQLTGGEPLLYPFLDELIELLKGYGFQVLISTSGYLPGCELSKIFKILRKLNKETDYIQVSLDGLEKTHNFLRGAKDAFVKTTEFIKLLIENDIKINIATVIQKSNINEIDELAEFTKSLGVNRLRLSSLMLIGNAKQEQILPNEELEKVINRIAKKYSDNFFQVENSENAYKIIAQRTAPNCGAGSLMYTIGSDFSVYACTMYRKPLFNTNTMSFMEGIKKNSIESYNRKAPNEKDCKNCKMINNCKGCLTQGMLNSLLQNCEWSLKWNS